jgi:nucleotide-binding universal stress UspA family protein
MEIVPFDSILVPVDGSPSAEGAVRLAIRLAAPGAEIVVAHAVDRMAVTTECAALGGGDAGRALAALEADGSEYLARASTIVRAAGLRVSCVELDGPAVAAIAECARRRRVRAIAMGTHSRGGLARFVLGSTAGGVIRSSSVPVLVVREGERATAHPCAAFRTIVAALDGSPTAVRAAFAAVDLAARDGGRVVFAHFARRAGDVRDAAIFAAAMTYAVAAGVPSAKVVLQAQSVDALVNSARMSGADLIVAGARGSGERSLGLGSVAATIVRTSSVPVLVMPSPALTSTVPPLAQRREPTAAELGARDRHAVARIDVRGTSARAAARGDLGRSGFFALGTGRASAAK